MATYGDSVPAGWSCCQTYIRNHHAMDAALRALKRSGAPLAELRILEIGGGVIEPLLLGALVLRHWPEGIACRIHTVDADREVTDILEAMRARRRHVHDAPRSSELLYDPETGCLSLAALARIFSSPQSPINPHLSEPARVTGAVAELASLGLLELLGLPAEPEEAARFVIDRGLPARPELCSLIIPEHAALPEWRPSSTYDLVVANFSLQYPIVAGETDAVAERLDDALAPDGLIVHGSSYGAQVHLLRALLARGTAWDVVLGARELAAVRYVHDPEIRLVIRTDALLRRDRTGAPALAEGIIGPAVAANLRAGNLAGLVDHMQPMDALDRSEMMATLWRERGEWMGWWCDRETLLAHAGPLPSRIEWRGAATTS